jgi:polysaccharide export outer membrane protein
MADWAFLFALATERWKSEVVWSGSATVRYLVALLLLAWTAPARADYLVDRGDVLLISVAEDPELGREAKVNADGRIMLPHLGSIEVAGSDLEAIRVRVAQELEKRDIIRTPSVLVEVATYRPFYVGGEVARPGAVPFEPGLTVRHALVLAGGLDRRLDPTGLSATELLAIKAKLRATSYELLQTRSRIARLEAELNRAPAADVSGLDQRLAPSQDAAAVVALDSGLLQDRLETWSANQTHLKDKLALADLELGVLAKQAEYQERERTLQEDEVENAQQLFDQGLIPLPRLQELEREASRMSRDLLENHAFAARARQTKATARYELASAETTWRIEVRRELADAMLDRTRLEAEIETLKTAGLAASLSLEDQALLAPPVPRVVIHRSVDGHSETIEAHLETEIVPGDVLDVTIAEVPNG